MIELGQLIKHPPKRETLIKFVLLILTFLGYFCFLSWKYDFATGGIVSGLTWSFFVLCTPIADAGFLLDFPVRIITNVRMLFTEIAVWVLAISINIIVAWQAPEYYQQTLLTNLLYQIIAHPWPYASIVILCGIGTFMSIEFADEIMDVASHADRVKHHKHGFKYRLLALGCLIFLIVVAYGLLLDSLSIDLAETADPFSLIG